MHYFKKIILVSLLVIFNSCGAYFNQPLFQEPSRVGEFSKSTDKLLELPDAAQKLEVAVYNFSDQTGQFKPVENGSTFSTAVTQGGTTILIKALEDSGWFKPIERENLSNLTTERNIIRNTKQEYIKNLDPNTPPLPPLLYAGLILEGGIISYDTNIVTGGVGARYFGLGASSQYRQDRITVYLRAVSTTSGEILKTIYVSKTILSQSLNGNFFRFVKFQRLLEAETGITQSEPVQIAVKDAIEKAVHDLIVEGVKDQLWSTKDGKEVNDQLVENYLKDKEFEESKALYNRLFVDREYKNTISFSGGGNLIDGDFATRRLGFYGAATYQHNLNTFFDVAIDGAVFDLNNGEQYQNIFGSVGINGVFNVLPKDDLSPFIYAGPGLVVDLRETVNEQTLFGRAFFKLQYGAGIQYKLNPRVGLKVFAEHNVVFSDELDFRVNGKRDDFYFNFGIGVNYNFNWKNKSKKETIEDIENED
ncbi:CsgG/HfaB family protein [uncultured Dokdonia sp.]|uniref:CsgG/HfaB family protein n=1 Tax=uncultured Dokdonia sp. TaxID=575653 RepID=UPI002613C07D|nr:CsgG/HfaB family protein [uncultured Dokdonia sp.]